MRALRLLALVFVLLLCFFAAPRLWRRAIAGKTHDAATPVPAAALATLPTPAMSAESVDGRVVRRLFLERLAYAQAWNATLPPALTKFRAWAERYRVAAPSARAALEPEGVALAQARRPVMLEMIKADPRHALAVTVPAVVRASLPPAVLAELESRVAGNGDYGLRAEEPSLPGAPPPSRPAVWRVAFVDGVTYTAHVYGRRESQTAKEGASLHGIALDRELALHESPLRLLEPNEVPGAVAAPVCPVSGLPVAPLPAGEGVNADSLDVVEAHRRIWKLCTGGAMLATLEHQLNAVEDQAGPRVRALSLASGPGQPPSTAPDAPTSNTIGIKRVLVLRVDTSDFSGDPVGVAAVQSAMDGSVKPNLEAFSYGQTSVVTTVSPGVYRLPRTGASYAQDASGANAIHADAVSAATVDYSAANFDRVVVVHPNLLTAAPTTTFAYAGIALMLGGTKILINGGAYLDSLTHELGHCYGLYHANLWQVKDGNPVSAAGTTLEYADPFDMMNSGTYAYATPRDMRYHFNPWAKNMAGWLPDSAVTNVITSGTYRIYRFDHPGAAALNQPLALRIFRDGVRWYWVGFRQSFTTNAALTNGAYVQWVFNNPQQSQLLDFTTPGINASDAALTIGVSFVDPLYGISITPIVRGGADPAQYLDVQVTVPTVPPQVIAAWGHTGLPFFSANAGVPFDPPPETAVPMNLTGVKAIAAGAQHALALKNDGTVVAWGNSRIGQTAIPPKLDSVIAIAAGGDVSGAVKADGTVQLWGDASSGLLKPPDGLGNVKQLCIAGSNAANAEYHALALKTDGTVIAWGDNTYGQTSIPAGLANVVAIATPDLESVALKSDGTVVAWGNYAFAKPADLRGVVAIAGASNAGTHTLAVKSDGTVVAWGGNTDGQATVPTGLTGVVAVAAGVSYSMALKADGTIVAWGRSASGETNVPPGLPRSHAIAASFTGGFALVGPHTYLLAQPQTASVAAGGTASFNVTATGAGALTYQWRKDGVAIPGATGSSLALPNISAGDVASYDVVVVDLASASALTSFPARLTLAAPVDPGRLINLSVLTAISAEVPSFTAATVLGPAGTLGGRPLLVRAVGPSLSQLGVPGVLADPRLDFYSGPNVLSSNDNWGGAAVLRAAFTQTGAFPLLADTSKDAAVFAAATAPGSYSVVVSGVAGATGNVIAEIYDGTASTFSVSTPRLINMSVLQNLSAGSTLTLGFTVGGTTPLKVLIRAIGPGLAQFGIAGGMADPRLTLSDSGHTINKANDNWGGDALIFAAAAQAGAFAISNLASKDAMLLMTLPPGGYAAQASGVGGAGGFAIVEVYEVP